MVGRAIAFFWGLAEATFFFLVPDVFLSFVVRKNFKNGFVASFYALAGALIGGSVTYWTGVKLYSYVNMDWIPGISPKMVSSVSDRLKDMGVIAIFLGPLKGVPYKIFALEAYRSGIGYFSFMAISIPARWIRFCLSIVITHYALKFFSRFGIGKYPVFIILVFWSAFYIWYFSVMG